MRLVGACQRRRGRRPREGRRAQALDDPHVRRQAHARADRHPGLGLRRRPSRPAGRRHHHPVDRAGHPLLGRRDRGDHRARAPASACPCTSTAHASPTRPRPSGVSFREFTTDAGVDVVSFGGTKNGAMLGEAVVVLNPEAAPGVDFLRKSSMQLASKMRFVVGPAARPAHRRPVAAQRPARQRDGPRLDARVRGDRGRHRRAPGAGERRLRRSCPPTSPSGCRSGSASTPGTRPPARCAGCAPGTPRSTTSTAFADAIAEEMARQLADPLGDYCSAAHRVERSADRPCPARSDLLVHDASRGQGVEMPARHLHRAGRRVDVHAGQVERALPRPLGEAHRLRPRVRDDRQPSGEPAAARGEHRAVPGDREPAPLDGRPATAALGR